MPKCLYCGGHEWFDGPSGGLSTNILCANMACRHWFNYTPSPLDILDDLHRIEPTPAERDAERKRRLAESDEKFRQAYQRGADAFERGAFALGLYKPVSCYTSTDDMAAVCGFIDAMAEKVRGSDVEERVGALEHPHRCPVCDCDFSSADAQRQHMLARHGG